MIIKLFTQPGCPKCPAAKKLIKNLKVEEYDTSTVDGLAEASFYTVMATPTILICNESGKIIKDFRGEVPAMKELLPFIE